MPARKPQGALALLAGTLLLTACSPGDTENTTPTTSATAAATTTSSAATTTATPRPEEEPGAAASAPTGENTSPGEQGAAPRGRAVIPADPAAPATPIAGPLGGTTAGQPQAPAAEQPETEQLVHPIPAPQPAPAPAPVPQQQPAPAPAPPAAAPAVTPNPAPAPGEVPVECIHIPARDGDTPPQFPATCPTTIPADLSDPNGHEASARQRNMTTD
ncbi:hypothetical protein [Corynebacterium mastitidis]|uniref:hypothetical protein n=1 Tax=Corynebacterium mastitidis TaxID=161890 RepID=UPI0030E7E61E